MSASKLATACGASHGSATSVCPALKPYRIIVIATDRSRTTHIISLDGAPFEGDELELPHGETVTVDHVTASLRDGLAGVVIAGPHK